MSHIPLEMCIRTTYSSIRIFLVYVLSSAKVPASDFEPSEFFIFHIYKMLLS